MRKSRIIPARSVRAGLLALVLWAPISTLAESDLQPHVAEYKVKMSVLGGQLKTELKPTETGYVATHIVRPTGMARMFASGLISDMSEFDPAPGGVRPNRFMSRDTLTKDKTNAAIRFDWDAGEARGTVNGEEVVFAMEEFGHDRISIQYELMLDLLHGKQDATYRLYELDELKVVNVRNIGSRSVRVPAGEFTAIGIQHESVGSSRTMTLWCVEELGFLPVIIEQHRKGKLKMRATLKDYRPIET